MLHNSIHAIKNMEYKNTPTSLLTKKLLFISATSFNHDGKCGNCFRMNLNIENIHFL